MVALIKPLYNPYVAPYLVLHHPLMQSVDAENRPSDGSDEETEAAVTKVSRGNLVPVRNTTPENQYDDDSQPLGHI